MERRDFVIVGGGIMGAAGANAANYILKEEK